MAVTLSHCLAGSPSTPPTNSLWVSSAEITSKKVQLFYGKWDASKKGGCVRVVGVVENVLGTRGHSHDHESTV